MSRVDLIELRRGSTAAWGAADPVLDRGEPGVEFASDDPDSGVVGWKVGNGTTPWSGLAYVGGGGGGGQTPWASDIDANGHSLLHAAGISFTGVAPQIDIEGVLVLNAQGEQFGIGGATLRPLAGMTTGVYLATEQGDGVEQFAAFWADDLADPLAATYGGNYLSANGATGVQATTSAYQEANMQGGDYLYSELYTHADLAGGNVARLDLNGFHIDHADGGSVPTLHAKHAVPWSQGEGLLLANASDAASDHNVEFMLGAGAWSDFATPYVLVDLFAHSDPLNSSAVVDVAGQDPLGYREAIMGFDGSGHTRLSLYSGEVVGQNMVSVWVPHDAPPHIDFSEGDNSVVIPSLRAMQAVPWNGKPGLVLAHPSDAVDPQVPELLIASGGWADFTTPYSLVDIDTDATVPLAYVEAFADDGTGIRNDATMDVDNGRADLKIHHWQNDVSSDAIFMTVDVDGPRIDFEQGAVPSSIPSLHARQNVPYEGLPGLVLAAPSGVVDNASEFLIAAGEYVTGGARNAIIDLAASTDPGFGIGFEQDCYANDGLGASNYIGLIGYPGTPSKIGITTDSSVANIIVDPAIGLILRNAGVVGPAILLDSSELGFYGVMPVAQHAAIADATDAPSVITQLNTLLAAMRDYGLVAV